MSKSGSPPKDTNLTIPHIPMADYKMWVQAQKESGHDRAEYIMLTHGALTYYKNEEAKREDLINRVTKANENLIAENKRVKTLRCHSQDRLEKLVQDIRDGVPVSKILETMG